jgi:hypothetical protein
MRILERRREKYQWGENAPHNAVTMNKLLKKKEKEE